MVPRGWKRVPIKEVCESIIDCVNKTAPVVDYETSFKMIRTTNVRNGKVNTEDVRFVTEDTYLQWVRRGKPKAGDIIFTREAPVGEAGILQDAEGIFLGQRTMMYRADDQLSDSYFLFYSLLSAFCQKQIEDFSNGGTVAHMRVPDCGEILINLPPLVEQKKIAQILSTWDKAIAVTEKLLTNSQQQKKALMQQLLTGKKRLLDENGVRFSGEWIIHEFGNLFKERVEIGRDDLPLLSITADDGVVYQEDTGRKNTSNEDKSKYRRICINDIGYNTMRMWQGRSSLSDKEGIVSPAYTIVTPSEKVAPKFAAYLFKFPALIHVFYRRSQGLVSDTWNLKFNHFVMITWPFPCIEEQQKIASVLSAADAEISTLEKKLTCLKEEKKALMQQLLTGKRRVKIDEAVAA
ncbi:restriction endonuclease subunit S [Yersinia intermedia]|uniref:restriction endonuclease subunit S n=1 Tax=Yersinia intermedia TaxID=631 RepID=UPI0039C5B3DD|nr:restriction endonuclease subunit S [Yersinia enterocolitica]EKN3831212.1 restriction endonuclease subunit S [Yersinia enterocolitica]